MKTSRKRSATLRLIPSPLTSSNHPHIANEQGAYE
jgi:hypothetical protein